MPGPDKKKIGGRSFGQVEMKRSILWRLTLAYSLDIQVERENTHPRCAELRASHKIKTVMKHMKL